MDRYAPTRRTIVGAAVTVSATGVLAQTGPSPTAAPGQLAAPASQAGLGPRLTMHAIDNFHGTPGAGMVCDLSRHDGDGYQPIKTIATAPNGRSADPLLIDDALKAGRYELSMHFADYFAKLGVKLPDPNFLGVVPIRFQIRDASQRYHLAVLFTPWGYSYYRGS